MQPRKLLMGSAINCGVAIFFKIVSLGSMAWIVGSGIQIGLFTSCNTNGNCVSSSLVLGGDRTSATAGLLGLSTFFVAAAFGVIVQQLRKKTYQYVKKASIAVCVAAVLTIVACAAFIAQVNSLLLHNGLALAYGWGYVLAWFSFVLEVSAGVMAYRAWKKHEVEPEVSTNTAPANV